MRLNRTRRPLDEQVRRGERVEAKNKVIGDGRVMRQGGWEERKRKGEKKRTRVRHVCRAADGQSGTVACV